MNRKSYFGIFTGIFNIALVFLAAGFLASCGSSNSNITPQPVIKITAGSGSGQNAQVSVAFAAPLVANVTSNGTALNNATVTFAAPASGASCVLSATTGTTDAAGNASVTCTANSTAGGPYNVTASASGATTPASFALTNTAAPTIAITATSGAGQSATVSTAFANPLAATVTSNGTPASGVSVTFTAPATGASGLFATATPAVTDTETTNSSGVATSQIFTANSTAGAYSVTATATGATTPATFALTNTAIVPPPPTIAITAASGSPQSTLGGTAFGSPLVANVTSNGTPLSGATVTFAAPTSGASCTLSATTPITTDINGNISVTCTADTTAGSYNVTASTSGATTSAIFALTNTSTVGPPANLTATSGGGQSATINTAFASPLVATVTDANNNPVPNITVIFTAPTTGASGTFATTPASTTDSEVTGANGQATSKIFTANATAGGPYNVTATSGPKSVTFAETNTSGTNTLAATSGGGQSATVSTAFASPLVATVTNGGVPVSGVSVTFTAPASGASGTFGTTPPAATDTEVTGANGQATSHIFTANSTVGGPYNVVASSTGLTSVNFPETNTAGGANTLTATSGGGQSATVSTAFTLPLVATVTNAGVPVSGVSVTFTAPASGASGTFGTTPPAATDTEVTGANGQATSHIFTANSTSGGPYNIVASSTGLASVVFAETNTAGATNILTATSGGGQSAAITAAFTNPLVATVTNGGNPVSGVSVTFTAPSSGASGLFGTTPPAATDTEVTGANGQATSHIFTANSTVGGPYNIVASSTGLTSVNFPETNTAGPPATLTATSGGGQTAGVGTAFANPLVATVIDAHSNPVSGVSVTFTAPASGASGTFATTPPAATDTEVTGSNGQATSKIFTANSTTGGYNVAASTAGVATVFFAETNTTETLTATGGGGQSTKILTPFALPLVATVTNAGVPVSGVSVTFTAPATGATGLFDTTPPSATDTEVTGANGQATSHVFGALSTAGTYNVVATSGTLTPVNFTETNNPAAAATLTATSGGGQSAAVSTAFALPLVATVTDSHSNPVSGVSVTFTAPASGASGTFATTPPATTDTEVTGSNGQATSKTFTANATAGGPYNVVASSTGLTSVNFAETNTGGGTNILTATSGGGQSATVGTAFASPLVATVTNGGNPVSGVLVSFTAPTSGASCALSAGSGTTNASGVVSVTCTANTTAGGPYNVVASSTGLTSVNFAETNTAGAAATLTATSGGGQSAAVSTAFTLPLVATVTDSHSNPVSGVSVTFTAPASGASGTFATTPPAATDTEVTGSNGQATSKIFTANATVGGPYNVVASSTGLTSVNFAETNTAGTGEILTATSGGGQSAKILTPFASPLVATVTSGGNPVSGVTVTFTAPASGASGLFDTTPPSTTDTETTNSSGVATSHTFGANSTAGGPYNVVASSTGLTSVNFAETNTAGTAATLTATSGGGQSAQISTAFALPLVATVTDSHSNPVSGVSVTFTAPSSGASGTFATTPPAATDTEVTGANGQATSQIFTANATAGGYTVVASSGSLTHANFAETNTTGSITSNTYVFYASGEDSYNSPDVNYYAIAGAVTIDSTGNVTAGEQDYNDAVGGASPEPLPDTITGGTLTVDSSTGQGTLTLITTNTIVGSPLGTEVFAVQFANPKHALIAEFDGWATSSGSLDLQTATTASTGTFAFALSGVDETYSSVAYGGVYNTTTGVTPNVILDISDDGTVATDQTFTATSTSPDTFGRSKVTGISNPTTVPATPLTFVSYVVGPEVVRIIDIDAEDTAVGSAYGQGSTTFTNSSLTSGVFTLLGQWSQVYATLGEFTADSTTGKFSTGTADDNELDNGIQVAAASIAGSSYNLVGTAANGYGTITLDWNGATGPPSVTNLGIYMVSPSLNINDPNNTSTDLGGALVVDLDGLPGPIMPGGIGVITPQTSTAASQFNGTYVAGFQDFNNFEDCLDCEFDMVSQGTMTSGAALGLTGDDSDPFGTWTGTPAESTGDTFTSTPQSAGTGIYSMSTMNSTPNPLEATINATAAGPLNVDIYQASGTTLYWIETNTLIGIETTTSSVFLGPIEKFTGAPTLEPAEQPQPQPNKNLEPTQRPGGTHR